MSSKRGRKRNDSLPPNRARDVQRAFRARRAAHLQALEQRVQELEEENNCLRQALNLPPSNRSPLGRGPTGKDKPKTSMAGSSSQPISFTVPSRESSTIDSPSSQTSSHSPHTINVSMSSLSTRPMQVIDTSSSWNNDMLLDGHQSDVPGPTNSPYQFTPMTAPLPLKPSYPAYTSSSLPSSSSRNSMSSDIYIHNDSVYSHSSDRPLSQSYSGQSFTLRNSEIHEEPSRHYSYTPSPFQNFDHTNMHSQSPSPSVPMHSQPQHQPPQHSRESPVPYAPVPHRRCVTDPHGFSMAHSYPSLPHLSQTQTGQQQQLHHQQPVVHHPIRHIELMRSQDDMGHLTPPPRSHPYGPDGRLNHHPFP